MLSYALAIEEMLASEHLSVLDNAIETCIMKAA